VGENEILAIHSLYIADIYNIFDFDTVFKRKDLTLLYVIEYN